MVVDKLLSNAASAEQTIKLLTQRLITLQKIYEQQKGQREQLEISKLAKENEDLKQGINHLKFDLECIRMQNGAKSISLPKSKPAATKPMVVPENNVTNDVEASLEVCKPKVSAEKVNKKKGVKETKKEKPNVSAAGKSDESRPIDASRLDLRVGKIVNIEKHPDADTLYVEKVDVGEEKPRTIVSGLVAHLKLEELQDRLAVFMCNLKPVKMRGIFSEGMIMCATTPEKVQPLLPPNGAVVGDKVRLQGNTVEPDALLNPKKKIWEQVKPDMLVNEDGIATYKGKEFHIEGKGACRSTLLKNCQIS